MYRTCLCLGQSALPIKTSLVSNLCLVLGQRSLRRLGRSSSGAQKVGVEQTGESNATEATTDGEPPPQHVWDHDQEDTPPSGDSVQRSKPRTPTPGSVSSEFITEYKWIGRARTIRGQEDEQSMMERESSRTEREPSRTEREPSRTEREWTPYCMEREKGSPWKWEKLWEEQFPKPGSVSSEFIREYKLVAKNSSKDEQSQMDREPSSMDRDEPSRMDRARTRMDREPSRMDREPSRMDREPSRMDRAPSRRMNQEFSSNSPLEKPPKIKGEVIYGTNVVQLAIQSHRRVILKVYTKREDILQLCEEYGIPTETISSIAMNSLSNQSIHQGVCADVLPMTLQNVSFQEIANARGELWLIVDRLYDAMNVGAILRSAYVLGVNRVLLPTENSCGPSPTVSKASAGAMEVMDISLVPNMMPLLENLREEGWTLIGTVPEKSTKNPSVPSDLPVQDISDVQLDENPEKNIALLIGNEYDGISPALYSHLHHLVTIQQGCKENSLINSLNVSVATAIILHRIALSRSPPKAS